MSSIHGHEVLLMMVNSDESFTNETLIAKIKDEFGEEALFHTCSAGEMTAEDLVSFLAKKGKFVPKDDGFNTEKNRICGHGGDHDHDHDHDHH